MGSICQQPCCWSFGVSCNTCGIESKFQEYCWRCHDPDIDTHNWRPEWSAEQKFIDWVFYWVHCYYKEHAFTFKKHGHHPEPKKCHPKEVATVAAQRSESTVSHWHIHFNSILIMWSSCGLVITMLLWQPDSTVTDWLCSRRQCSYIIDFTVCTRQ